MRRVLKYISVTLMLLAVMAAITLAWLTGDEWRPDEVSNVDYAALPPDTLRSDTLTVLCWNIGYAGLGADMDFFYDGGRQVRASREQTAKNLDAIIHYLRSADVDIIMLQEVDSLSKRNYDINLYEQIVGAMPEYHPYYALNYDCDYVPIPLRSPIGQVRSGVLTLTRYAPVRAVRYSLPNPTPYPERLFNLKRAMLSLGFLRTDGVIVYVNNLHCSAFDNGTQRAEEVRYISEIMTEQHLSITAGDWNSTPSLFEGTPASTPQYTPYMMSDDAFPSQWHVACDLSTPTMRFNNAPYDAASSLTGTVDFAVSTPGVVAVECRTVDLGFARSDHNPVILKFTIQNNK